MNVYLDSSVVLRHLLRQARPLARWGKWEAVYASVLLRVEVLRAVDRLRLNGVLDDPTRAEVVRQFAELSAAVAFVPLQDSIVELASRAFPSVVGTLDALHLATAMELRAKRKLTLIFLTHDAQLGLAAQSMNFHVEGV